MFWLQKRVYLLFGWTFFHSILYWKDSLYETKLIILVLICLRYCKNLYVKILRCLTFPYVIIIWMDWKCENKIVSECLKKDKLKMPNHLLKEKWFCKFYDMMQLIEHGFWDLTDLPSYSSSIRCVHLWASHWDLFTWKVTQRFCGD